MGEGSKSSRIDPSVPHPARRYNYWLGGKDHFAADRASGDRIAEVFPVVVDLARANRAFLRRGVRFLAESGVRQFLDIGTGLPAPDNTHEVAQRVAPECRIVYVDNDPVVMSHARALLRGDTRGRIACVEADLRDPGAILAHPTVRETLDLRQPVGLLLVAVLHFIKDDATATAAVRALLDALPPGSFLAMSHSTLDFGSPAGVAAYEQMFATGAIDVRCRPKDSINAWLTGLEIVTPGIVAVSDWRPEATIPERTACQDLGIYAAIGRKH
ncbi:SAM-dependent methyltransferase [Paractinoplanes rishiriensis]|uniref:SAM-dependent methyltransferase n=1 Tax=Paractinoplanes rishiriensis TaxID=1050105 RepID=A0A919MZK8_9ACTN|nr:SAM-dependent methyltransferase [Actinoplanes rishiriensis]GIF01380.1 hypothetical protein Ari01nite_88440 [Actinoplanes rishiriensis]